MKGTRDYNVGDSVDPSVASAALDMMVQIPKNFQARELKETEDIVNYDVLLVMDKYTAADVLREVMGDLRWIFPLHRCAFAQEGTGVFSISTAMLNEQYSITL